ncbi:RIP homotypic interaction motif-containing protein [Nocardia wallacei]|uniref:nSTAND1 domain-containing NTPase n=1 Tax=Nocardia wallacei TaxID=480035 RepID=UPI0024590688|nr:RIP homotypic interaction motif-containing protein [Nocardia wallacei]
MTSDGRETGTDVAGPGGDAGTGSGRAVDARHAQGVQIGDHNTQVIYSYHGTWSDGVAPAPLIGFTGEVESPYRGLGWFSERDAPFFYGRDSAIDEVRQRLSRRLKQAGILIVTGVSGAGKSSLVRAGVISRIHREGLKGAPQAHAWPCLLLTAGHSPLDELAIATAQLADLDATTVRRELHTDPAGFAVTAAQAARRLSTPESGDGGGLILIVDQFEQVFTQCPDPTQRQAFITALHAAATTRHAETTVLVVLVVRADFEAGCGDYEELIDAVQHHYLVTAMTERQLRMAITEPAKQAGSRVDDDLTDQLLREIRTRVADSTASVTERSVAGVLPLLSYALDRTWRLRAAGPMTIGAYERSGGLEGAVADSAHRAYSSLTQSQQSVARRVFTRLVIAGTDGADTADRVQRRDLSWRGVDDNDVDAVLAAFAGERLLTLGAETVEISHEVLLSTWPLLRDTWLAETRENRAVCARLRTAAAEWERQDRDAAHLYSGRILDSATAAADHVAADPARYPPLGDSEQQFLAAGIRAQRRRSRQRYAAVGVLMFLVVALTAATLVAVRASVRFARQRDQAVAAELVSRSEQLAPTDPDGSRVTALAAWRIAPGPETRHALLLAAGNPATAKLPVPGQVSSVAFSPDGATLATASNDDTVRLWDVRSRKPVGEPLTSNRVMSSVAFGPEGTILAAGGADGTVRLWNAHSRQPIGELLSGNNRSVYSVAFSHDGGTLATSSADGTVRLWDVRSRQPNGGPLTGHTGIVLSVAFSNEGTTLATGGADGTVRLWDARSHQPIGEPLTGHTGPVSSVAFSPDGASLATGGQDHTIRLWDVPTRQPIGEPLTGHTGPVSSVAFSPDGTDLATAGWDNTVRLWNTRSRRPIGEPLTGHTSLVSSLAFSPDGTDLATAGWDNTVRLWNMHSRRPIGEPFTNDAGEVYSFGPDGTTLAVGSNDGAVRLWDVRSRQPIGEPLTGSVSSLVFSPDRATLATGDSDGTVRLWDAHSRTPIGDPLTGRTEGAVSSIVFNRNGTTLAAASADGPVRLWDVHSRKPIDSPPIGDTGTSPLVAFSRDGTTLATVGSNMFDNVRLWDVRSRRPTGQPLAGRTGRVSSMAFSPDGATLAIADEDNTVNSLRLWDVRTRQPIGEPFTGYTGPVASVVFSPDGATLATVSHDGTVRLWDVRSRRTIGEPLAGQVESMAFSPDGTTLATADRDNTVRLWDVDFTIRPEISLCEAAPTFFTHDQWNKYVPTAPAYTKLCP